MGEVTGVGGVTGGGGWVGGMGGVGGVVGRRDKRWRGDGWEGEGVEGVMGERDRRVMGERGDRVARMLGSSALQDLLHFLRSPLVGFVSFS